MIDPQPSASPAGRDRGPLRLALVAACLLLTFQSLAGLARWRDNRGQLELLLAGRVGDDAAAAERRLAFEPSVHHAQLIVARSLIYAVLAPDGETPRSTAAAVADLEQARDLARAVLRRQPNNWQASMFLGGATYLAWSLRSDRRLFTAAREWEEPLLKARREAMGKPEPRRFLASAYLETWPALSQQKKAFASEILRETFRDDRDAFARLGPIWMEVADDQEQALAMIPDRPEAWQLLQNGFARSRDWDAFCLARRRYSDALEAVLEKDLEEARQRARLGDLRECRKICLLVVVRAPREMRFAGLVTRALELYPPGLHGLSAKGPLDEWLSWALELHSVGVDPLPPPALKRLSDAAGDLEPPVGALAALIGEDAYHTRRYERLVESKRGQEWAPFLIAKSQWLVERGELAEAARALADVHKRAHGAAAYWLARRSLARATGDLADLGAAEERLAAMRRSDWQPLDWRWRGRLATLEMYPEIPRAGRLRLSIEINQTPERGAVLEIFWNGEVVALTPARAGEAIGVTVAAGPKPNLLELRSVAGGEVYPGRVRLEALSDAAADGR